MIDGVMPIEDCRCAMSADLHGDVFRDLSASPVSDSASPHVVEMTARPLNAIHDNDL